MYEVVKSPRDHLCEYDLVTVTCLGGNFTAWNFYSLVFILLVSTLQQEKRSTTTTNFLLAKWNIYFGFVVRKVCDAETIQNSKINVHFASAIKHARQIHQAAATVPGPFSGQRRGHPHNMLKFPVATFPFELNNGRVFVFGKYSSLTLPTYFENGKFSRSFFFRKREVIPSCARHSPGMAHGYSCQ